MCMCMRLCRYTQYTCMCPYNDFLCIINWIQSVVCAYHLYIYIYFAIYIVMNFHLGILDAIWFGRAVAEASDTQCQIDPDT